MALAAAALLSAAFLFGERILPAVKVEGEKLAYADFFNVKGGLVQSSDLQKEAVSEVVLEEGVIEAFVEDALVKAELQKKGIGEAEVTAFLFGNVTREELDKLNEATGKIYGWSVPEFEGYVLMPQARRIMLVQALQKENKNPDEWLKNAKKEARVSIYLPRWKWENGAVEGRY